MNELGLCSAILFSFLYNHLRHHIFVPLLLDAILLSSAQVHIKFLRSLLFKKAQKLLVVEC